MPAAKKIVKKLALNRETVRSLNVRTGVLTGQGSSNEQSVTGWPPSHPWTQSNQNGGIGSANSGGMGTGADSADGGIGIHVKFGLMQAPP